MRILQVDPVSPSVATIRAAAEVIRSGGLVAFPTETVYGLGANALDPEAVGRIYGAKGRPAYNPLIVHVPDVTRAREIVAHWPDSAERLATSFWPGPLTLVLPKRDTIPDTVTAGLPTVGVRVPAHPVAIALLRAAGTPVAAPSANPSMQLSPTAAAHVSASLGDRVDLLLDAGPAPVGIESTVVDLSSPTPTILRPGMISAPRLSAVLGSPVHATRPRSATGGSPRSPGMLDRHYSPRARLVVTSAPELPERVAEEMLGGASVGVLAHSPIDVPAARTVRMPADAADYARRLFSVLHDLDAAAVAVIIVESVPGTPEWDGVRDRLMRARN